MNVNQVASFLKHAGLPILLVADAADPQVEDAEIQLTPTIHVQVGYDYLNLVRECDGGEAFHFYKVRRTPAQLVADFYQAQTDEVKEK